jgi:hypothetical protein
VAAAMLIMTYWICERRIRRRDRLCANPQSKIQNPK